jgi:hypothetical protein
MRVREAEREKAGSRREPTAGQREAFRILPLRMQRVQTRMRRTAVPTLTRMRCTFGSQRRLDTLCAWLMRFPKTGFFPHISHIIAMVSYLRRSLEFLWISAFENIRFSPVRVGINKIRLTEFHIVDITE